jgi:hypothetical protein
MDLLGKKLKHQKELREKAKKPRKKQEYTPVEIDTGLDDEKGGFENDPEPGETTITVKSKNKPLPLPPTAKPAGKSPKPSPGVQHRGKSHSSGDAVSQPQAAGLALMHEIASKKGGLKSKAAGSHGGSSKRKDGKPLPSVPDAAKAVTSLAPPPADQQGGEECEPVYANTFAPSQDDNTSYQNCDFSGPPSATPTPTPTPATGGTQAATSAATAPAGQSEYQNINFGVQKQAPQTKKKPKTAGSGRSPGRSPNVASKNRSHSSAGSNPVGGAQVNGSIDANSAGQYQNFQFGVLKK